MSIGSGYVNIVVDDAPRLSALSYTVPTEMALEIGDAVEVPFGTRQAYGIVVGDGDPERATRAVTHRFGRRADPADVAAATEIASRHFADLATTIRRLSPRKGRDAEPLDAGPVTLVDHGLPAIKVSARPEPGGRFVLRPPLVDPARLAAEVAANLARDFDGGQVLVLCPTKALVAAVVAEFDSGAARLDANAPGAAWSGFVAGTVPIGVGTRAAALFSPEQLVGIVVVEEDHPGHIEATQPHTHARDVAALRARLRDVPLVLTGAAPSAAGLGAGVKLVKAGSGRDWPRLMVVNRDDFPPETRLAPPPVRAVISRDSTAARPALIVGDRGFARRVCARCRNLRPCGECDQLGCTHKVDACERCSDTTTKVAGWDADRFAARVGGTVRAVTPFELTRFSTAGIVVVWDIDRELTRPGLTPAAAALRILCAAATAAGPGGTVIVCTSQPRHPLIAAFAHRDLSAAARVVYEEARTAGLPPFGRLLTIRIKRSGTPNVGTWPHSRVFGPKPLPAGEWELLVATPTEHLAALSGPLDRFRRQGKVRVTVT